MNRYDILLDKKSPAPENREALAGALSIAFVCVTRGGWNRIEPTVLAELRVREYIAGDGQGSHPYYVTSKGVDYLNSHFTVAEMLKLIEGRSVGRFATIEERSVPVESV
jgi:hypothetical protein